MSFVLKTVPLHKPKLMANKGFYGYSPSKSAFFAVQKFPHFLCQSHSTGTSLFPYIRAFIRIIVAHYYIIAQAADQGQQPQKQLTLKIKRGTHNIHSFTTGFTQAVCLSTDN